jgi:hypothetical protein
MRIECNHLYQIGLTECDKCPAGTQPTSAGEGQTACTSCQPGSYTGKQKKKEKKEEERKGDDD